MHNISFPNSQFKYYILFVDHYSRFSWIYMLNSKLEAFDKFAQFNAMVATQFSLKIKTFRSDGEGEFTSNEFKSYLTNHGISQQISCPHTPQQNGVMERKHKHIIETVIALLSQASLNYLFGLLQLRL